MTAGSGDWISRGTKVAILGVGSFNPPTIMHLRMFELAKDHIERRLGAVVVDGILSPVADFYGKDSLVKAAHRLEMARLAVLSSDWIRADGWECTQTSWTRTRDVLRHHQGELGKLHGMTIRLMLVCGGDVVDSFARILPDGSNLWSPIDIQSIVSEFGLIVVSRETTNPVKTLKSISSLCDDWTKVQIVRDEVCPCDVSSTRIRAAIKDNRSIKYSTPDPVINYIKEHGLYQ